MTGKKRKGGSWCLIFSDEYVSLAGLLELRPSSSPDLLKSSFGQGVLQCRILAQKA